MNYPYVLGLTVVGILTGLTGGVVGAGSEIMVVPLLTMFGLLKSFKHRIGTSLVMLLPPIGIMAAYRFHEAGYVDVKAGLYMGLLFAIFSYISSYYTVHLDNEVIQKIFAVGVIFFGCYLLWIK